MEKKIRFRLVNTFLDAVAIGIIAPVIISMNGLYMSVTLISAFAIIASISVYANTYIVRLTIGRLLRIIVLLDILLLSMTSMYFVSPTVMVYGQEILLILVVLVEGAFSINFITHISSIPDDALRKFQVDRGNYRATGSILGLGLSSILSIYFENAVLIMTFMTYFILVKIYVVVNIRIYDDVK